VFRAAGCGPREELLLLRGRRFQDWKYPWTSEQEITELYKLGQELQFKNKIPKAVFRGTPTGHQSNGPYNLFDEHF